MRILIYEDEDFKLEFKEFANEIFLHCLVFNWSLSSLKKGRGVFRDFKEKKTKEGYSALYTVTPNPKFAKLLGGERIGTTSKKGKEYEVFKWELK